jgi:homoserine kinase
MLRIPGSTSNLGPGLDTLALALRLYTYLTIEILDAPASEKPIVSLTGRGAEGSQQSDQANLVYKVISTLLRHDVSLLRQARVTIKSEVPLGAGLGSTSSAILGALWASSIIQDLVPTRGWILQQAGMIGGHTEFLAASLMGGLVISSTEDSSEITTQRLSWPDNWHILALVPEYRLASPQARAVLPETVALKNAIYNIQRTALLVAAVVNEDEESLRKALDDRLHEQYRTNLVPHLQPLRSYLSDQPILGCVLSGAGAGMIVFVNERRKEEVRRCVLEWIGSQSHKIEIFDLQADQEGIQELPSGSADASQS